MPRLKGKGRPGVKDKVFPLDGFGNDGNDHFNPQGPGNHFPGDLEVEHPLRRRNHEIDSWAYFSVDVGDEYQTMDGFGGDITRYVLNRPL